MSSRETILAAITQNKPSFIEAPVIDMCGNTSSVTGLVQQFKTTLESIGGTVKIVDNHTDTIHHLQASIAAGGYIVNTVPALGKINEELSAQNDAVSLASVDKAYIQGTLGVAENGAIWVEESKMINRLLPFICQHLILVLSPDKIVPTLHEAYRQLKVDAEGYGLFIAGPSKTADIEQSLVIGAHGARSLEVYITMLGGGNR